MLQSLVRNWWIILIRGLIAIGFGLIAFIWPGITIHILLYFFGIYLLVDGLSALIAVFFSWGRRDDKWLLVLDGFLSIGVGLVAFRLPDVARMAIIFMVGFWAIMGGIIKIAFAIHVRFEIKGEGWIGFSGLVSIILGFFVIIDPTAGALSIIWLIAALSVALGVMWVITAFRIRSFGNRLRY